MHCRGFCHQLLATLPEMVCVVSAADAGLLFPVSQQVVLQLQGTAVRTWAPADKGCLGRGILVAPSASLKSWQVVLWVQSRT